MINKNALADQLAIVKTLSLHHNSLVKLAQAGYKLDRSLVEIFDTAIAQIALRIETRVVQGYAPRLPTAEVAEILAYVGLPLASYNLAERAKVARPGLNLWADVPTFKFEAQEIDEIDPETIDVATFDLLLETADTFQKRCHLLNEGMQLLPDFQEDLDLKVRDLFVLKAGSENLERYILACIEEDLATGKLPCINIDSLPDEAGVTDMVAILTGLEEHEAISRIISPVSVAMMIKRSVYLTVRGREILVGICAHTQASDDVHARLEKLIMAERKRSSTAASALTAEDVLASQSQTIQDLMTGAEHSLIEAIDQGRIPIVEIDTDMSCTDDGSFYIAANGLDRIAPMLMEVFARYMRLKHGVRASISSNDEGRKIALIDLAA
jgi:hypothetical protein